MSTPLSPSGLLKPEDGDDGSVFWDLLEALFDAFNSHTHDGDDSSTVGELQSISSAGWSENPTGSGIYEQTVNMALVNAERSIDATIFQFRDLTSGHIIYPTWEKIGASTTTYRLKVNDSTLAILARYV